MKKPKQPDYLRLREREVSQQVKDFLAWHGWRVFRNQVANVQNAAGGWFHTGENGMPDLLFVYYFRRRQRPGTTLCLWIETKQEGKGLRPDQITWQRNELARGALVLTVDKFEPFRDQYRELFGWLHESRGPGEGQMLLTADKETG
jgi:hypothetical protein